MGSNDDFLNPIINYTLGHVIFNESFLVSTPLETQPVGFNWITHTEIL
jgi:hypothetical protein